jgi:hypothetical protein
MEGLEAFMVGAVAGAATQLAALKIAPSFQSTAATTLSTPSGASTITTASNPIGTFLPWVAPGAVGYMIGGGYGVLGAVLAQGLLALLAVSEIH